MLTPNQRQDATAIAAAARLIIRAHRTEPIPDSGPMAISLGPVTFFEETSPPDLPETDSPVTIRLHKPDGTTTVLETKHTATEPRVFRPGLWTIKVPRLAEEAREIIRDRSSAEKAEKSQQASAETSAPITDAALFADISAEAQRAHNDAAKILTLPKGEGTLRYAERTLPATGGDSKTSHIAVRNDEGELAVLVSGPLAPEEKERADEIIVYLAGPGSPEQPQTFRPGPWQSELSDWASGETSLDEARPVFYDIAREITSWIDAQISARSDREAVVMALRGEDESAEFSYDYDPSKFNEKLLIRLSSDSEYTDAVAYAKERNIVIDTCATCSRDIQADEPFGLVALGRAHVSCATSQKTGEQPA